MKAFLFSDLHCSIKQLIKINEYISSEKGQVIKALVFAGDVVNMGEPVWVAEDFIRFLEKIDLPFLWVPGNNDFGRAYHKINAKYKSLEGRIVEILGRRFAGVGGSPASWSGQYQGEAMVDRKAIAGTIFVSHVPPPGVFNWQKHDIPTPLLEENSKSKILNPKQMSNSKETKSFENSDLEFVSNLELSASDLPKGRRFSDSPLVHICGHIHHQWGCSYLGQTKIIKLASLETGHYAILDLEYLSVEFERF